VFSNSAELAGRSMRHVASSASDIPHAGIAIKKTATERFISASFER
jgi:hypothetical protein